jgi:hypothetical protein
MSLSSDLLEYIQYMSLSSDLLEYIQSMSLSSDLLEYIQSRSLCSDLLEYIQSRCLSFDLLEYIQSRSLSSDLLEYIQSRSLSFCNSIKTFDFSTRYTTIPNSKLKNKLRELVQLCFIKNNGQRRYKYLVLGRDRSYFVKHHSDSTNKCSETDIFSMLEYLIDNIFAMFSLVDVFFNRQSAYLWVQAVLLFSPTCSFIRMRQTS